jgi:hypothetical protein
MIDRTWQVRNVIEDLGGWFYPFTAILPTQGGAVMLDVHKMAVILSVLWITAATTMTLASAQEAGFSEGELRGLTACLVKCPDGDMACNNRCISQAQTKGRVWSNDVRACIRGCRNGYQLSQVGPPMVADRVIGCIAGCRLDRLVR